MPREQSRQVTAAHGGGPHQGFSCSLLPGTLSSRGPPPSLVFRTEDVCRRCNQFIETAEFLIRFSPSHSYNAGRAGHRVAYIHTYTHEHTQTHKRTCAHSNTYKNTHTHACTVAHAHTNTHTHRETGYHMNKMHTDTHMQKPDHTRLPTYTHTHIHT